MSNNRRRRSRGPAIPQSGRAEHVRAVMGDEFEFEHAGRRYRIPPAGPAARSVKAGAIIDAVESEDEMQLMRIGLGMLRSTGPDPEAWAAIRDMDMNAFGEFLTAWMRAGGVNPGKYNGSSN